MPFGFSRFKERQFLIRSDYSQVLLHEGSFNKLAEGLTVYVRARQSNGEVQGILVHDSRNPEAPVTMMAERGALVVGKDGPRFLLVNGNRQEMEPGTRKLSLLYFDRYSFDLSNLVNQPGPRWREPRERYVQELLGPPQPGDDPAFRAKLRAEGHQRLASPLYCIVFALIALAATLGGEFNRRGRVHRMLSGGGAAVVFQGVALALGNVLVMQPAVTPLFYAYIAGSAMVAMILLLRSRTNRVRPMAPELEPGVA
jgi:lipopolysaccharide export system permease protein